MATEKIREEGLEAGAEGVENVEAEKPDIDPELAAEMEASGIAIADPAVADVYLNDKITDYSKIGEKAGRKSVTAGKTLDHVRGIALAVASKHHVMELSHGEVLISETINYRTQRPERGGLFCEQIFGPRKNYECACGKYKRIRYKGVVCERCGVEVTTNQVRRQRMGHIELAAPVAHIWFLKSIPSRIGLFLDIPLKKLEQVIYFAAYLVTDVYEDKKEETLRALEDTYKAAKAKLQKEAQAEVNEAQITHQEGKMGKKALTELEREWSEQLDALDQEFQEIRTKLSSLTPATVIGELDYRMLHERFPHVFKGGTGAEYVKILLERVKLKDFISAVQSELKAASKSRQKKLLQKLRLAINLYKSGQRPENFVLEAVQVLPPDLRPMIQLDGGRMASSDLNDLYRRVINRNNRLKKLIQLGAPEVILKNEKRMLQESVDALIMGDARSSRSGYAMANKRKLKSLTDVLKGKQGRFRQNLLGKRVDYSGRSVIVVGPKLKMNECGLPKSIALTLFKPFVIGDLLKKEIAFNVKHAEKVIEDGGKEVWDSLEEVIRGKHVLLNRAPTLHRLGIQAFRPTLIEGKAIQLHPLTCTAFNADFDGDQMAVHVPLTPEAQEEAATLMTTSRNMLNPSNGEPIVAPTQDMILGCYYLTRMDPEDGKVPAFSGLDDATHAYDNGKITLHTAIDARVEGKTYRTSYGRILFNQILPDELRFYNDTITKSKLKKLLSQAFDLFGSEDTAQLADKVKNLGYKYATISGLSIAISDMISPTTKPAHLKDGEDKIRQIQQKHWHGLLSENERYYQSVRVWSEVKNKIEKETRANFGPENHISNLVESGARGTWSNITQLCGMKGLVASPSGKTIELPIKSNLKEGFSTLEYFIATHGGRKGKADTALKTAQSGYMTRKLVDAAQAILVREVDCGTLHFEQVDRETAKSTFGQTFEEQVFGKTLAEDAKAGRKVIAEAGSLITKKVMQDLVDAKVDSLKIRTLKMCETEAGVCQKCYGMDLARSQFIEIGSPIGIVAAQSIGEPGTQLTMRTFHSGGVAKEGGDITMGLARVEELFEARIPKYMAVLSDVIGTVRSVEHGAEEAVVTIEADDLHLQEYYVGSDHQVLVKKGQKVEAKDPLAKAKGGRNRILAVVSGKVEKIENGIIYVRDGEHQERSYKLMLGRSLLVKKGQKVAVGDALCEGHKNPHDLMRLVGVLGTQKYIVNSIKEIYASQGQTVNAKHVELIVRQMFSKIKIIAAGDTDFFPGDVVDSVRFKTVNAEMAKENKREAVGERMILGIAKVSLLTDSWLSAGSFQETVRVLVEAACSRRVDKLDGLKNNVIIGRRIPTLKYFNKNHIVEDEPVEYQDESVDVITGEAISPAAADFAAINPVQQAA